ncbi:MAG: thiamine phosphate synthase [Candidatus Omnitrophica bacterium]|nr:thiamine phosphate synthase [Candidatus Omnitrophota bacterium]MBU3933930.1 thiamine phosphate synthase [Candidatus Omnitrophota bacterium]MBU4141165.1 thiamine phosphate synthase [Candidatus Omnitrophota bacterium]
MRDFRLYVILDVDIAGPGGDIVEIARKTISAGADILQLRAKSCSDRRILKIGRAIKNLVRKSKVLFVLNDRADLARIIDADGLHLGREDLPVKDARNILDNNKIIGLSTHSVEEAKEAERQKADYIAIGPIFPTATKPQSIALTPGIITKIKDKVKIPFVAVGGINLDNLDQVKAGGAQRVAVCRAIITAKDVFAVTKEFRQRLYR